VNINVTRNPKIIANPRRVDLAQLYCIAQAPDPVTTHRPWRLATADDDWGQVSLNLVDQALREEGRVNLSASLYEHAQDAAATELIEQWPESHAPVRSPWQHQNFGLAYISGTRRRDQRVRSDQFGVRRGAQLRIEDHTQGLPPGRALDASGQLGIVGDHRANADKDGVVSRPKQVAVGSGFGPTDPP
jgi:hypothetical protein